MLQIIIDIHPQAILMVDFKGTVLVANKKWISKLKKNFSKIIGANIYNLLPSDLAKKHKKNIAHVIQTGKTLYEEDEEDEKCHVGNYFTPIIDENGHLTRVAIFTMDVTGRKRIKNMMGRNGEKYRSYVETMNDGFIVLNKDIIFVYVNDKFCQIIGYEKDKLLGRTVLNYLDKNNKKIMKEQVEKSQKGESGSYHIECLHESGNKINVLISSTPVFDSEEVFQGSFATITDVTQSMKKEALLTFEHQAMKQQFEASEIQMKNLLTEVEEYNHALKILLKNNYNEKKEIEENVFSNAHTMIYPFIEKLKNTLLNRNQRNFLELIENNLNSIVSPFIKKLKAEMWNFTPMEIQIANMIKEGKNNKEIADILNISENTVLFHRKNIREKLGLKHKKINLRTHLLFFL